MGNTEFKVYSVFFIFIHIPHEADYERKKLNKA